MLDMPVPVSFRNMGYEIEAKKDQTIRNYEAQIRPKLNKNQFTHLDSALNTDEKWSKIHGNLMGPDRVIAPQS